MKKTVIVILLVCRNNCIFCSPNPITQTISEKEIKKIEYELLKDILELRKKEFDDIEISGSDPIQNIIKLFFSE